MKKRRPAFVVATLLLLLLITTSLVRATSSASGLSYEAFSACANEQTVRKCYGSAEFSVLSSYPTVSLTADKARQWPKLQESLQHVNALVEQQTLSEAQNLSDLLPRQTANRFAVSQVYSTKLSRADAELVSLEYISRACLNSTVGNTSRTSAYVIEPGSGKICGLSDFITEAGLSSAPTGNLAEIISSALEARYGQETLALQGADLRRYVRCQLSGSTFTRQDGQEIKPKPFCFLATGSGLRFIFQPYELACGMAGRLSVDVNYSQCPTLFTPWAGKLFAGQATVPQEQEDYYELLAQH